MSSEKYQNYVNKLEKETALLHGAPDSTWIIRNIEIMYRLFAEVMDDLVPILKSIERKIK